MKAKQLMLGNYALYNGLAVRVRNIHDNVFLDGEDESVEVVYDDGVVILVDPCSLEPIPLTPEILEKNGFRKLVTYGTEKWLCDNLRLNVYSSDGTWRFCADTNRNENSVIYIRFVHELQNAISLCGIEKEITI